MGMIISAGGSRVQPTENTSLISTAIFGGTRPDGSQSGPPTYETAAKNSSQNGFQSTGVENDISCKCFLQLCSVVYFFHARSQGQSQWRVLFGCFKYYHVI
jgi:hypothetical protein